MTYFCSGIKLQMVRTDLGFESGGAVGWERPSVSEVGVKGSLPPLMFKQLLA